MPSPTFILVHGAWHGAWCWRELTPELDRRKAAWRSIDLPSSHDAGEGTNDLYSDADAVARLANSLGPVVLVGHSYGGAVISEAASRIDDLSGLVYIAALRPTVGQSASEASRVVPVRTALDDAMEVRGAFIDLNDELAVTGLYLECSPEIQSWAVPQLTRQTLASFRTKRTSPDVQVPTRFVLCRNDRALDASLQEVMAAGCDDVIEMSSDHSPFLSHPVRCSEAILKPA